MINLTIIDDHQILRQGIIRLLKNLGDYQFVAEVEDGNELVREFKNLTTKTDIFLMDYSLPKKNGIEVLKELQPIIKDEKFLILTQNNTVEIKVAFYKLGARGFISKTCTGEELKTALDQVHEQGYFNLQENLELMRKYDSHFNPVSLLSKKELDFIRLVCREEELTYEQIADLMCVSTKTVDYYRNNLFEKFNIKSKTGLILLSHKYKLTEPFL